MKKSNKVASADSGEDGIRVNGFLIHLSAQEECVGHEVVHDSGVALGVAVEGGKSGRVNDGFGAAGADQLMADIVGDLGVRQAGEGIMDGNTLAQGLVDRFAQGVVEIRLTAEDESKAVDGVIAVIHKHFNIVEDSGGEILRLVHRQQEGLAFFFVEMKDLVLDCVEHARLTALGLHAEDLAELPVELHHADSGQADILHVVEIGVQGFGEAAQGKGLAHARPGGKDADAPGVFELQD